MVVPGPFKAPSRTTVHHRTETTIGNLNPKTVETKGAAAFSSWFFTINTNQTAESLEQLGTDINTEAERFKDVLDEFQTAETFSHFWMMSSRTKTVLEDIKDFDMAARIEVGSKHAKLHAHALLKIKRRIGSRFQIGYSRVNHWLSKKMGYIVYVHIVYVPDHQRTLESYIDKNQEPAAVTKAAEIVNVDERDVVQSDKSIAQDIASAR